MTAGKYLKIISADISHSVGAEISLSSYHLALWLGIDFLFTQTVINILSTASWRGVWNIFDIIFSGKQGVFHDEAHKDSAVTCSVGIILNIFIYASSKSIQNHLGKMPRCPFWILSRLSNAMNFIVYMLLWRSFWNLFYLLIPTVLSKVFAFLGSSILLVLVKCFNSNIGVPASINLDNDDDTYCKVETFLSETVWEKSEQKAMRLFWLLADVLITVIIEILVIICWFGTYEIIVYTLPSQPDVSKLQECIIPLILGVLFGGVAYAVQLLCLVLVEGRNSRPAKRRVVQFIIALFGLMSTIFHWYGMWTLLDYYILPEEPVLSNLVTAGVGIVGLSILGASRSLQGGVARDGAPGECYPLQPYFFITRTI